MANAVIEMKVSEPYWSLLKSGLKPVEGRKNSPTWSILRPGDTLVMINDADSSKRFMFQVDEIHSYPNIRAYLEGEILQRALPDVSTIEEGEQIYLQWSTRAEVERWGFIAICGHPC